MTKSYQTADIFAQRQGLFGRQGGPAVLLINVSKKSWDYFLSNGAKEDAPISNMPGHFQDFVPINMVEFFNVSAKFAVAPAP
jgi:hypothetical protein